MKLAWDKSSAQFDFLKRQQNFLPTSTYLHPFYSKYIVAPELLRPKRVAAHDFYHWSLTIRLLLSLCSQPANYSSLSFFSPPLHPLVPSQIPLKLDTGSLVWLNWVDLGNKAIWTKGRFMLEALASIACSMVHFFLTSFVVVLWVFVEMHQRGL